ncbi:hypothetical protein [Rhodococcus sp. X156]|uniref:hypothetical protein n=1 Tax=Rhodococcus sp. X156 TaxID=2499145 RepID=UPI000FDBB05B|nr:hypothetical protein [Rhodococcus sp. X156]
MVENAGLPHQHLSCEQQLVDACTALLSGAGSAQQFRHHFAGATVYVERSPEADLMVRTVPGMGSWVLAFSCPQRLEGYEGPCRWQVLTGGELQSQLPPDVGILVDPADPHTVALPPPRSGARRWAGPLEAMVLLRPALNDNEPLLYAATSPAAGAREAQLGEVERRLGHPLERLHRELLACVNGWRGFTTFVDLLSTDELGRGARWESERTRTAQWFTGRDGGVDPATVYLLGASEPEESLNQLLLWRQGPLSPRGGRPVIWLDGDHADHYPDLYELLVAELAAQQDSLTR